MGKLLLSSSQVSVVFTVLIIFLCTTALFLSGYVVQQRTLRELRTSIQPRQPRPKPEFYLPEQFKSMQPDDEIDHPKVIDLTDETSGNVDVVVEVGSTASDSSPEAAARPHANARGVSGKQLAMLDEIKSKAAQQSWAVENPDPLSKSKVPITAVQRRKMIKEELRRLAQSEEKVYWQRRLW